MYVMLCGPLDPLARTDVKRHRDRLRAQEHLSTGRRNLCAADVELASVRALDTNHAPESVVVARILREGSDR